MPTEPVDPTAAALRLTVQLNARAWGPDHAVAPPSAEVAARTVTASDAAHHVVDTRSLLGLDPWHASELAAAIDAAALLEPRGWVLALPRPGHLGALRGPAETNAAALAAGAAVLGLTCRVAWVPTVVGSAVQWTLLPSEPPAVPAPPSEAERAFSEAILAATSALTQLDVAGGPRPDLRHRSVLPAPYDRRRQTGLDRALMLYEACLAAVDDDGTAISSYEMARRRTTVAGLVGPASDVIVAICSTRPRP